MSIRSFIRKHIISFAIIIFISIYLVIHQLKPAFIYNKDGTLRQFEWDIVIRLYCLCG